MDTTQGYWHVDLDHESSLLCTFNTPFGRYRFKRRPFGIVVSQDIFQRRLDDTYRNIIHGKRQQRASSVLMLPSGWTESLPSTITCHHLTSSCLAEDPSQCFQAVSLVYNHCILTKIATKKPIYVNKQSTLLSTTRKQALKQAFSSHQPVYVWSSIKHIWEPGKVFNLPNPGREPRTYLGEMQGKIYQQTREHLRPRITLAPHTSARECVPGLVTSQETPGVEASPLTTEMQAIPHPLGKAASASSVVPAFGPDSIQAAPTQSPP